MTYEKKPINHSRHQCYGDHEAGGPIIKLISPAGAVITNYGSGSVKEKVILAEKCENR
jgi:hypothetical protein